MRKFILSLLAIACLFTVEVQGQLIGSENQVTKELYEGTFVVNGNKDKYYPVVFKRGEQNKINHLRIYRGYHEAGPNELSATHKGGLLLEIEVNYGGWGGQQYGWKITNLRQAYHDTFANASHASYNTAFIVWLRGGGFKYHYESEKPANLQVALSTSELIFEENPQYLVYAPAPLDTPNKENITMHSKSGFKNIFESGANVGIGTTPSTTLDVNGYLKVDRKGHEHTSIQLGHQTSDRIYADNTESKYYGGGYFFRVHDESVTHKYRNVMMLAENGNVGIGALKPKMKLELGNLKDFDGIKFGDYFNIRTSTLSTNHFVLENTAPKGNLYIRSRLADTTGDLVLNDAGGNVGIGTTKIPTEYRLAVDGKIGAREIKVESRAWPDYVFTKDYNLPTLKEVEKHIKEKGHLPNIPSAKEVEANKGIELGEMNRKLLEKVEELTLYTIQQEKQLKMQSEELNELKKLVQQLVKTKK